MSPGPPRPHLSVGGSLKKLGRKNHRPRKPSTSEKNPIDPRTHRRRRRRDGSANRRSRWSVSVSVRALRRRDFFYEIVYFGQDRLLSVRFVELVLHAPPQKRRFSLEEEHSPENGGPSFLNFRFGGWGA